MTDLVADKKAARAAAVALRDALHRRGVGAARLAAGHALREIGGLRDVRTVSAYLPFRSEIDPRPTMLALAGLGFASARRSSRAADCRCGFASGPPARRWPKGALGVEAPAQGDFVTPDALLVPLLAFDADGWRLGYGGGFYDRTLAQLREARPVAAIGFAYAGQQVAAVPRGPTDMPLDAVVTEAGVVGAIERSEPDEGLRRIGASNG